MSSVQIFFDKKFAKGKNLINATEHDNSALNDSQHGDSFIFAKVWLWYFVLNLALFSLIIFYLVV